MLPAADEDGSAMSSPQWRVPAETACEMLHKGFRVLDSKCRAIRPHPSAAERIELMVVARRDCPAQLSEMRRPTRGRAFPLATPGCCIIWFSATLVSSQRWASCRSCLTGRQWRPCGPPQCKTLETESTV